MSLSIVRLYHDLLGTYGDQGNVQTISWRLNQRGIANQIVNASVYERLPSDGDFYFLGGGEDDALRELVSVSHEDRIAAHEAEATHDHHHETQHEKRNHRQDGNVRHIHSVSPRVHSEKRQKGADNTKGISRRVSGLTFPETSPGVSQGSHHSAGAV